MTLDECVAAVENLRVRVDTLEGRPPEPWQIGRWYEKGTAVTIDGVVWIANRAHGARTPGTDDAWRLA